MNSVVFTVIIAILEKEFHVLSKHDESFTDSVLTVLCLEYIKIGRGSKSVARSFTLRV